MSTKKKPAIDLSKCVIGQKHQWGLDARVTSHKKNGRFWPEQESDSDVVAILPLPKKAAKKVKVKSDKALQGIRNLIAEFKSGRDVFSREIKRLEGLL